MLGSGGGEISFSGCLLAAWALLLAVAVSGTPHHQSQNAAVIAGVVVDGTTGQPLSGAAVSLASAYFTETVDGLRIELPMDAARAEAQGAVEPRRILTGADGSFRFTGLRGGRYRVEVVRRGYWPSMAGRDQPTFDGRRLRLEPTVVSPGASLTGLTIRAWPLGAVEGQVTDADGEPLAGVYVTAHRRSFRAGRETYVDSSYSETDDRGFFRFSDLRPGVYVLSVPSTVVTLPDSVLADRGEGAELGSLGALSSGLPVDLEGHEGVGPHMLHWRGPVGIVTRGGASVQIASYTPTFYPGVDALGSSTRVTVAPGSALQGMDLRVATTSTTRVSGVLSTEEGAPAARIGLRMMSRDPQVAELPRHEVGWTMTDDEGRFTFLGVPPGLYHVTAVVSSNAWQPAVGSPDFSALDDVTVLESAGGLWQAARTPSEAFWWTEVPVNVGDRPVEGLEMTLSRGFSVQGRFEFDRTSDIALPTPAELSQAAVEIRPVDRVLDSVGGSRLTDGTFQTSAQPPGRYELTADNLGRTWRVSSIMVDGREVLPRAILVDRDIYDAVVTFTDRVSTLSGSVVFDAPGADAEAVVVVFPRDFESWIADGALDRVTWSTITQGGAFTIQNVLPGRYLIAAVPADEFVNLQDPDAVRAVARIAEALDMAGGANRAPLLRVSQLPGRGRR